MTKTLAKTKGHLQETAKNERHEFLTNLLV
jgi:hypothetical protein